MDTGLYCQRRLLTWYVGTPALIKQEHILNEIGLALEETNSVEEASRTYESMLPHITSLLSTSASTQEQRYWTENLLTRHCMLSSRHVSTNQGSPLISAVPPSRVLAPFRAYSKYWDTKNASSTGVSKAGDWQRSCMRTWSCYYDTLSVLLQRENIQHVFGSKLQQAVELKKVEATYESILLGETTFPRADQANSHIESWVDQVMANWRVMCGHTWQDEDLGEGGKASLGSGVLKVGGFLESKALSRTWYQSTKKSANSILYRSSTEQLLKAFTQQEYFATFSLYMQL